MIFISRLLGINRSVDGINCSTTGCLPSFILIFFLSVNFGLQYLFDFDNSPNVNNRSSLLNANAFSCNNRAELIIYLQRSLNIEDSKTLIFSSADNILSS